MVNKDESDYLNLPTWIKDADDSTVRGVLERLPRSMSDLANEHWHATGHRLRRGDTPIKQVIPAEHWQFLRFDGTNRIAKGGGVKYIAVEIHAGPPESSDDDIWLANMREAYKKLDRPSMRKVAELTGYSRNSKRFKRLYRRLSRDL